MMAHLLAVIRSTIRHVNGGIDMKLEAPWNTFRKKLTVLFEPDPDITIGYLEETDAPGHYLLDIQVSGHEKCLALRDVLPKHKYFGKVDVVLNVTEHVEEPDEDEDIVTTFSKIFRGNQLVNDIKDVVDPVGVHHGYVRFWPQVLQFYDDDLRDYEGNWSGLAQDIAREVFEDVDGVNFCTANVNENK